MHDNNQGRKRNGEQVVKSIDSLAATVRLGPCSGAAGANSIARDTPTVLVMEELSRVAEYFFPIPKSGGFAKMFGYIDRSHTPYCVKVLRQNHLKSERAVRDFINEYCLLKLLSREKGHEILRPHALIQVGAAPDALAMVLEYVPNDTLLDVKHQLNDADASLKADIGAKIARILGNVHRQGIVHRDVKPENIFYNPNKGWPRLTLFDFGLARNISELDEFDLDPNVVDGTPMYIAPEVIMNPEKVDHRSDIYSLGAVLFELFVGHPPYSSPEECGKGPGIMDLYNRKVHGDVYIIGKQLVESRAPFRVGGVILNCLARDPENRYQSVGEVEKELDGQY
ncbi:serine/threonine protein kinase [Candidatus Woesearchaeota archaeon]|nr:serine/threonine protein kinase [Candidatus Woesearchaeota archaeon]